MPISSLMPGKVTAAKVAVHIPLFGSIASLIIQIQKRILTEKLGRGCELADLTDYEVYLYFKSDEELRWTLCAPIIGSIVLTIFPPQVNSHKINTLTHHFMKLRAELMRGEVKPAIQGQINFLLWVQSQKGLEKPFIKSLSGITLPNKRIKCWEELAVLSVESLARTDLHRAFLLLDYTIQQGAGGWEKLASSICKTAFFGVMDKNFEFSDTESLYEKALEVAEKEGDKYVTRNIQSEWNFKKWLETLVENDVELIIESLREAAKDLDSGAAVNDEAIKVRAGQKLVIRNKDLAERYLQYLYDNGSEEVKKLAGRPLADLMMTSV